MRTYIFEWEEKTNTILFKPNGNNKSKVYIVADSVKVYPKEQKQTSNDSGFQEDIPWN